MISQYVLKVHSRCNLACDHCYVYEHADQSWRAKPHAISLETADAAAARIAEHAASHQLEEVRIVLHGGEPMLLGRDRMRDLLAVLRARFTRVRADIRLQTNGILLDERWCELLGAYGVKVGVSLDGAKAANDKHRRFADGRSSYLEVIRGLAMLRQPENRHLYAGILSTIDIANDPIAVYEALLAQAPPRIDLLLPHATWDNPPARPIGHPTPYAAWLTQVYRRWSRDGRPVPIRLFDSLLSSASGGPSWSEAVGLDPVDLMVIETDGSFEEPDSLKVAFQGAAATHLNVFGHSVDEVAKLPGFVARQGGLAALSHVCGSCPVVKTCGGGLYAHRYRAATGFDNPSVYCSDLKALITSIVPEHRPRLGVLTAASTQPSGQRADHAVTARALDSLAAGPGDLAALTSLAAAQLSISRALVAAVATGYGSWRDGELRQAAAAGWELLSKLDVEYPAAVGEILSQPHTRVWAVRCLSPTVDRTDPELDRAHLAALAAAAAMRAGIAATLPVPVRDRALHLPGMGLLRLDTGTDRTVLLSISPQRLTVPGASVEWHGVRRYSSQALSVAIEDLDPFRDCPGESRADRLSGLEFKAWRRELAAAESRLITEVPHYVRVLDAGLRAIVPLRPGASSDMNATARHTFGAVAIALPDDSSVLGALLLHQFQHVKLNALIDMQDLVAASDARRLTVPWRKDPQSVEGVLHGAYAHLALAHLRRSQGARGRARYLRHRSWVSQAAMTLLATGGLTSAGQRFVSGMAAALGPDSASERASSMARKNGPGTEPESYRATDN